MTERLPRGLRTPLRSKPGPTEVARRYQCALLNIDSMVVFGAGRSHLYYSRMSVTMRRMLLKCERQTWLAISDQSPHAHGLLTRAHRTLEWKRNHRILRIRRVLCFSSRRHPNVRGPCLTTDWIGLVGRTTCHRPSCSRRSARSSQRHSARAHAWRQRRRFATRICMAGRPDCPSDEHRPCARLDDPPHIRVVRLLSERGGAQV